MTAPRDFRAEAEALLTDRLLQHEDEGVRALAAVFRPPDDAVDRVAARLEAKAMARRGIRFDPPLNRLERALIGVCIAIVVVAALIFAPSAGYGLGRLIFP